MMKALILFLLVLVMGTAQGARNVYHAFALWDDAAQQFRDPSPIQLCNYDLMPEKNRIFSSEADGYRYVIETVYEWEGFDLHVISKAETYAGPEDTIGERLLIDGVTCWDEHYPEEWYYGQNGVSQERLKVIRQLTVEEAEPVYQRVAHVDWVNVRKQNSKASPSIAKLDQGTLVRSFGDVGDGWVRIWYMPDGADQGVTGYIWRSFLD